MMSEWKVPSVVNALVPPLKEGFSILFQIFFLKQSHNLPIHGGKVKLPTLLLMCFCRRKAKISLEAVSRGKKKTYRITYEFSSIGNAA